jgi:hypothetical protein
VILGHFGKVIFNRVHESASGLTWTQRGITAIEGGQAQTDNPIATKNTKKASSHTVVSRALISASNRIPAKYDFAGRETAAPMGARETSANTQRPFCVFCGNWIAGLGKSSHREIVCKKLIFKVSGMNGCE